MNNDDHDDLLAQLKAIPAMNKEVVQEIKEDPDIQEENVEEFLLKKCGALVDRCMDSIDAIKPYAESSSDPETMESYASLIKACTNALNAMSKTAVQIRKDKTIIKKTQMEIEAKREELDNSDPDTLKISATRNDILKLLIDEAKKDGMKEKTVNPQQIEYSD